ncbi:MAG: response regulator transcription factor [Alphaproteobacteria bacterium]
MRILLADDHAMVRDGLKNYIQVVEPNTQIIEAETFDEAAGILSNDEGIDLIILDLNMPGMNRMEGLDKLHAVYPETPVVILSGSIDHADIMGALDHGAAGYFPKTMGGQSLTNALRLVLSGERYVPSVLLTPDCSRPADTALREPASKNRAGPDLSERETAVLGLLARGKSNKEIARDLGLQEATIKTHVTSVFRKLDVSNRTEAAREAYKFGLD